MDNLDEPSTRGRWGVALAGWCAGVSAFQVALASGAPWGAAAWGGAHSGVLPDRLRLASGVSALAFVGVAAIAARHPHPGRRGRRGRRWVLLGMGIYLGFGVALNAMSPSVIERAIWVPLTALGSLLAFQAWREH
ncbi:MAG: hypothetical protein WA880_01790 [Ornithinimicrobium sp.]